MEDHDVVTCFLRHGTEVLLLRRSETVDSFPGRWDAVSGYAEGTLEEAARREVAEKVGRLEACTVVRSADPLEIEDRTRKTRWHVHPFLFECDSATVDSSEEIADYEWVQPPEILNRETVPGLWETYLAAAPSVETVREDTDHGSAQISLRALEMLRDHAADTTDMDAGYTSVLECARELRDARPEMGVVTNRINRVIASAGGSTEAVLEAASTACTRALEADRKAAVTAAELLGDRVLTLSRSGTVLQALRESSPETVAVAESRPGGEGVGVTEELAESGTDVTLLVDSAVGYAVETLAIDTVLVGADSVWADGTVLNKVGTRLAALSAAEREIDCYVVCSKDKITPGKAAEIEESRHEEVYDGAADIRVFAPTFEPVSPDLVTGVVTEDGVLSVDDIEAVATKHAEFARWDEHG